MAGDPTPTQRVLLERYLDELATWTQRINLTAVPREQAWSRHVDESVVLINAGQWPVGARVADIGSGGGIPGVVVAVLRPDLRVTLVESDRRKAAFLTHVCGLLALTHVDVASRRAQEMATDPAHREGYDVAISRACAPPAELVPLVLPLLRRGGSLWALVRDAGAAVAAASPVRGAHVAVAAPGVMVATRT